MIIFLKVIQVILALSILVLVHEFGHFFFARLFKIKVEKFYLFFDAGFALLRWKPKKSDTEYGIGWLPFGGYCKIAGMIDESMDKEQLKKDPQPWEFRAHPAWQRFFVLFGGVFFNLILAIIIYSGILFTKGEEYVKNSDITTGIVVNDLGREIGFQNGDKVLKLDGKEIETLNDLRITLITDRAKNATIDRNGEIITINIDEQYFPAILNSPDLFDYGIPFVIDSIPATSQNYQSGLKKGDKIIGVATTNKFSQDSTSEPEMISTKFYTEVKDFISNHKNQTILATVEDSCSQVRNVNLSVDNDGLIGIFMDGNLSHYYNITHKEYSFFAAIPAGIKRAGEQIVSYWKQLKLIFSPKTKAYKSVGSFIAIGSIFPSSWDWLAFWSITAFLSIMLAVLNILPIPALDGGHILFTLYEMITGKKPSDKFLMVAQTIGMIFLIALMILAFGNDIFRLIK